MFVPLLVSLLGSTPTSGVVGLKTNDPRVIERAIKFFLEDEPDHCVELVRVAKGEGVVLAFPACKTPDGHPLQMGAFASPQSFTRLARELAQPVWGGFAVAGSSARQRVYAVDAEGRVRWTSDYDFAQSEEDRRAEADPFADPIELRRRQVRSRNGAGYGRLAAELGFDYWLVINIETGEADLTSDKRRIVKGDVGAHLKWLQSPWSPPEGHDYEPEPAPLPAGASGLLVCNGCGAGAAATIAAALGELARNRGVAAPPVVVRSGATPRQLALRFGLQSEGPLWPTIRSRNFLGLVLRLLPEDATLVIYEREADVVRCVMQGQGALVSMPCLPDKGVPRLLQGSWAPVAAPTGRAAQVAEARRAQMEEVR